MDPLLVGFVGTLAGLTEAPNGGWLFERGLLVVGGGFCGPLPLGDPVFSWTGGGRYSGLGCVVDPLSRFTGANVPLADAFDVMLNNIARINNA